MITSRCNLSCNYCFANKLVNQADAADMTIENFKKALEFSTSSGPVPIGLVGGEPTLHKHLDQILSLLIQNTDVYQITLFSNGIELDPYIEQLNDPKIRILFNCNLPPNITDNQYKKMVNNIENYFSNLHNNGGLGINVYKNDLDCVPIFKLARKYRTTIRISLTIPTVDFCNEHTYFQYLEGRKSKLIEIIQLSHDYEVPLQFDCDMPPLCEIIQDETLFETMPMPVYTCSPVIDITKELEAVRCFGMSHMCKVKISDFSNLEELNKYFIDAIDKVAATITTRVRCTDCNKQNKLECFGGCIRFKTKQLLEKGVK